MKVLLQSRTTLFSVHGGDTVQVLKTAEQLRALGCEADINLELTPDLSNYDLVHLFNLTRPQESTVQAWNARRQGRPVVLSTIYLPVEMYEASGRGGLIGALGRTLGHSTREYLKVVARAALNREWNVGVSRLLTTGYRRSQKQLLAMSDVLLPNSQSELDRVHRHFPVSKRWASVIVPNGVDPGLWLAATETREADAFRDCVLCAARIEGRKNQLNLIRAMKGLPFKLVLAGKAAPNHSKYMAQVLAESDANVHFAGSLTQQELVVLYRVARVHALVSWGETTGLSSLEAAVCGCNLVITDKGDTRDYFGDYAWYCDPSSVGSIREAILRAHKAPLRNDLRDHVLQNYTWRHAAERTVEGYEIALCSRSVPVEHQQEMAIP